MKQLKVIINSYNANNGYINANFNQSIDINPYSSIALDKISLEIIPNASGTIELQSDQTINIVTQNGTDKPSGTRSVVLKAGKYTYNETTPFVPGSNAVALPDIIYTLNNLFNGVLIGTPLLSSATTGKELDYGLGFKWIGQLSTDNPPVYKVRIDCYQDVFNASGTAQPTLIEIGEINIAGDKDVDGNITTIKLNADGSKGKGWVTDGIGAYGLVDNKPIISGCFQGNIRLIVGNVTSINTFSYGLAYATDSQTIPVIQYGVKAIGSKMYIINNGVQGVEIDINLFRSTGTVNVYLYTDDTNGNLRLCVEKVGEPIPIVYTTPVSTYTGYNFNTPYFLAVSGFNNSINTNTYFTNWRAFHQPNITFNNSGLYYELPLQRLYLTTTNSVAITKTPNRQIQINFSNSPLLIDSLGFGLNIIQGDVSVTATFSYTGPKGIDFSNYYDLGLDIINLNLETYVAFSNGKDSGKKNTLCYFLAQRIPNTTGLFFAESKQMMFLSIENKEKINVSTLQFRVYDINTGLAVNLTSGSFNVYIKNGDNELEVNKGGLVF